eukprot:3001667-Amphidinium_carterae.1
MSTCSQSLWARPRVCAGFGHEKHAHLVTACSANRTHPRTADPDPTRLLVLLARECVFCFGRTLPVLLGQTVLRDL